MKPLVSIIIPTYNRAHLISETLNSIRAQSYTNWECIIIDDGSNDNTKEVLNSYLIKDTRFSYYKRLKTFKKGPSGCRNYGFSLSKGAYVNWFDSDDIMKPNKLEKDVELLKDESYDFTISQTQYFESDSNKVLNVWNRALYSDDPLNDFIMQKIGWSVNAPLWRKKTLIENNFHFDERLFNGDDYYYHIQALTLKLMPVIVQDILSMARVHPNRIEEFGYKAYSKSIIVYELLKYQKKYKLSKECIDSQKKMSWYLLKNMYKHKKINHGLSFSIQLYKIDSKEFSLKKVVSVFFVGLFYYITGKGYSYFNKV
ncbi:glycosyltransferase family 2 protein [Seonamhaeicola sediminis]|uniref:glycosyltransferase family 2 protein n=1 Tax=Seonamhaeicola sediminis TaxID=2528206 RepID=UPI0016494F2D|nr:glycosyltransferase family 2 protein [Seonamhaeicola sediminis]